MIHEIGLAGNEKLTVQKHLGVLCRLQQLQENCSSAGTCTLKLIKQNVVITTV